jgi:hypothetical protein
MAKPNEEEFDYPWTLGDPPEFFAAWMVNEDNVLEAIENARDIAMMGPEYLNEDANILQIGELLEAALQILRQR